MLEFDLAQLPESMLDVFHGVARRMQRWTGFNEMLAEAVLDEQARRLRMRRGRQVEPVRLMIGLMDRRDLEFALCGMVVLAWRLEWWAAEAPSSPEAAEELVAGAAFARAIAGAAAEQLAALDREKFRRAN